MTAPRAVLLDIGGIFHLPDHATILGAFARGGFTADPDDLDRAHYVGAAQFRTDYDGDLPWAEYWEAYLGAYVEACGVPVERRAEVLEHLRQEFSTAALWTRLIPGATDGLAALAATGVRLGVVSNADGMVATRLREQEVLQVGPGAGVEVGCIIDSGAVGVQKPDARIFQMGLLALDVAAEEVWYVGDMPGIDVVGARAAGLRPWVMDPFGLHGGADFERVASLSEVASLLPPTPEN